MHSIILFTRANLTHRAYRHEWFHALESSQCVSAEEVFICKFMYAHMHIQVIVLYDTYYITALGLAALAHAGIPTSRRRCKHDIARPAATTGCSATVS